MIITQASYFHIGCVAKLSNRDDEREKLSHLRPWAPLQRLWPVRLAAVNTQLRHCRWAIIGLHLIEMYFPNTLDQYGDLTQTTAWDILVDLAHRVEEADWFQIDWDVLNEAWAGWLGQIEGDEDYLATFVRYIPLRLYGFNQEPASISIFQAEPGLYIEFFPPAELLYALLDSSATDISSGLLVAAELYDKWDNWGEADRQAAWARLQAIEADPAAYPVSARWLPALAQWACGSTDNPILKWSFTTYYEDGRERLGWNETDVAKAKSAWQEAKPVIEQFDRLLKWCHESATNLVNLAEFLTEGKNVERLDWSQVALDPEEDNWGNSPVE